MDEVTPDLLGRAAGVQQQFGPILRPPENLGQSSPSDQEHPLYQHADQIQWNPDYKPYEGDAGSKRKATELSAQYGKALRERIPELGEERISKLQSGYLDQAYAATRTWRLHHWAATHPASSAGLVGRSLAAGALAPLTMVVGGPGPERRKAFDEDRASEDQYAAAGEELARNVQQKKQGWGWDVTQKIAGGVPQAAWMYLGLKAAAPLAGAAPAAGASFGTRALHAAKVGGLFTAAEAPLGLQAGMQERMHPSQAGADPATGYLQFPEGKSATMAAYQHIASSAVNNVLTAAVLPGAGAGSQSVLRQIAGSSVKMPVYSAVAGAFEDLAQVKKSPYVNVIRALNSGNKEELASAWKEIGSDAPSQAAVGLFLHGLETAGHAHEQLGERFDPKLTAKALYEQIQHDTEIAKGTSLGGENVPPANAPANPPTPPAEAPGGGGPAPVAPAVQPGANNANPPAPGEPAGPAVGLPAGATYARPKEPAKQPVTYHDQEVAKTQIPPIPEARQEPISPPAEPKPTEPMPGATRSAGIAEDEHGQTEQGRGLPPRLDPDIHMHPAQKQVPSQVPGWLMNEPTTLHPEDAHREAYPEPMANLSESELREAANRPPLPMPRGDATAKKQIADAWKMVSRLWPDMANEIKGVKSFDKGATRARAFRGKDGVLYVPLGDGPMKPDTLWHELVHAQQASEDRLPAHADRTDAQHIEIEREATSRQGQMNAAGAWGQLKALTRRGTPAGAVPRPRTIMDWNPPGQAKPTEKPPTFPDTAEGMRQEAAWRAAHPEYGQGEAQQSTVPTAGVYQPPLPPERPGAWAEIGQRIVGGAKALYHAGQKLGGKMAPRTSALSEESGNAVARLVAAGEHARRATPEIADKVLGKGYSPEKDMNFGTMFQEMRHLHARDAWAQQADLQRQEADYQARQGDTEAAQTAMKESVRLQKQSDEVGTFIGGHNSPLTEADFRNSVDVDKIRQTPASRRTIDTYLDAINNPDFKKSLENWRDRMVPEMEKNYRGAQGLDEDDPIQTVSQIPGLPMNAKPVKEGETPPSHAVGTAQGNLRGQVAGRYPFAVPARLNQGLYDTKLSSIIENSLSRGNTVARKAELYRTLVTTENAQWAKPGDQVQGMTKLPGVKPPRGTQEAERGESDLWVKNEAYGEVRDALKTDRPFGQALRAITSLPTEVALASTAEATAHIGNQFTALLNPGMSVRGFVGNLIGRVTGDPAVMRKLTDLARIGATKPAGFEHQPLIPEKYTPRVVTKYFGHAIDAIGDAMRVTASEGFDRLVEKGLVEPGEANKRDFINQIMGNYHKAGQSQLVRFFRDTGIGPFATAATTFTIQGVKSLVGGTNLKATSPQAKAQLWATKMAKVVGFGLAAPMIGNYLMWGRADGDDKTPIGAWKVGEKHNDDGTSTSIYIDMARMTGAGRGARVTGVSSFIEGKRAGKSNPEIFDDMKNEAGHAIIHPAMGPLTQFLWTAGTGQNAVGRQIAPVVAGTPQAVGVRKSMLAPPGSTQGVENLKAAAMNLNPTVSALSGTQRLGQEPTMAEKALGTLGPFAPHFRKYAPEPRYLTEEQMHQTPSGGWAPNPGVKRTAGAVKKKGS